MGGSTEQLALLREDIRAQIAKLERKANFWRPRAFLAHLLTAVIGALITIIAGWKGEFTRPAFWPPALFERQNWLLLLGALITGVNAWQAFYNHRERWIAYASTSDRLRALLARLEFQSRSTEFHSTGDGVKALFDEFSTILAEFNRLQMTAMADKKATTDDR